MSDPWLSEAEIEALDCAIRRILTDNGCPISRVPELAFELVEKIAADAEIGRWFLEKVNRGSLQ